MRSSVLGVVLLAAAQVVAAGDSSWIQRFSFHDPTERWNMGLVYSVNPDAGAVVFLRDERPAGRITRPLRLELVYVDLATGQQEATLSDVAWGEMCLSISNDGKAVAILRPHEGISIWRPFDGSGVLRTYGPQAYELPRVDDRSEAVYPTLFVAPAFSPNGQRLAYSGTDEWWTSQTDQQGHRDAIGILDLGPAKVSAIPLPFATEPGTVHLWHLAWSADGEVIWVAAHGPVGPMKWIKAGRAIAPAYPVPADWTLFRCSVADRTATAVGPVPPSIMAIEPSGDLIVSDVDHEDESQGPVYWRRTAFGVMPRRAVEENAGGGAVAAKALGLSAAVTKVVPAEGGEFVVKQVFVGKQHTYVAGVLDKYLVILEQVGARREAR